MPAQRLPMRQVRELLRLKHAAGASERHIAASLGISRSTVAEYLRRAAVVGITWPVPDELGDIALERRLFSPPFAVHESPRPSLETTSCCVSPIRVSGCRQKSSPAYSTRSSRPSR